MDVYDSAGARVGATMTFDVRSPVSIALQVAVARRAGDDPRGEFREELTAVGNALSVPVRELVGADGQRQHLVVAEPGVLTVTYDATDAVWTPDEDVWGAEVGEGERVQALRPSRYCPSDRLVGFARNHFAAKDAEERVRAICAYVARHVAYVPGTSLPTTDAAETLLAGQGVCRDFAHLVAALCRAVDVPARIAAVYAPGLWPMDLHAVVETELDGRWQVWDATRLAPRQTLVRIATGRDAADIAFATVLSGQAELTNLHVWAHSGEDLLPFDDHEGLTALH